MSERKLCRGCGTHFVNRPRGLCHRCFYLPDSRERWPSTSKYAAKNPVNHKGGYVEIFHSKGVADRPIRANSGSEEKIAELQRRASLGFDLFHAGDTDCDDEGRP